MHKTLQFTGYKTHERTSRTARRGIDLIAVRESSIAGIAHGAHAIVPNTAQIASPRLGSVCIVDVGGHPTPLGAAQ